jgi:hypothetical protein
MTARAIFFILTALSLAGCGGTSAPQQLPGGTEGDVAAKATTAPPAAGAGFAGRGRADRTSRNPGATPALSPLERDKPAFYPVLRSAEDRDPLTKTAVNRSVTNGLAVFAFRRDKDSASQSKLDYVLKSQLPSYGLTESQLLDLCFDNFMLAQVTPSTNKQGGDIGVHLSSSEGFTASLLAHPATYKNLSRFLRGENLVVYIGGRDLMLATTKGSRYEAVLHDMAEKARAKDGARDLKPAVYYWAKDQEPVLATKK